MVIHRLFGRILTLIMLFSSQCGAQEDGPILPDRPDFTEAPYLVSTHTFQLEAGYAFSRSGDKREHALGELLVRYSLSEQWELRVGLNSHLWMQTPFGNFSGFEDASLGFKFLVADRVNMFGIGSVNLALLGGTTIPTGAASFGEGNLQPECKVALGWDITKRVNLSSNVNYTLASEGGGRFHQFAGSLSLGISLTDELNYFLEFFGFIPSTNNASNTQFLNAGFGYLVSNDCQVDVRGGVGLNEAKPEYFGGVGIAWRR